VERKPTDWRLFASLLLLPSFVAGFLLLGDGLAMWLSLGAVAGTVVKLAFTVLGYVLVAWGLASWDTTSSAKRRAEQARQPDAP
jgi:hypothetical protein